MTLRQWTIAVAAAVALATTALPAAAQTPEDSVRAVVSALFDGMRTRDTAAIRATFHDEAVLITTGTREGAPFVGFSEIAQFVTAIGGATVHLDERLFDVEVRRDAGLATVWTAYDFYAGGNFSHCGYDAFLLGRTAEGWKILTIADTRRREGCPSRN